MSAWDDQYYEEEEEEESEGYGQSDGEDEDDQAYRTAGFLGNDSAGKHTSIS